MRCRKTSPLLAGLLLTPLFVVLPMDVSSADPAPHPVAGGQRDVTLTSAEGTLTSATGLDAAQKETVRRQVAQDTEGTKDPGSAAGVSFVSDPQPVPARLAAVAVTWQAGSAHKPAVQVRTQKNGTWGAWELLGSADSGPDTGRAEGRRGRAGTELTIITNATQVQTRIITAPGEKVIDPKLSVIDPGQSDADEKVGAPQAGAAHALTPRPNIYTRRQWGADESWRTGTPESNNPRGIVIHHTADSNDYGMADVPGMMRAMYRYATKTLEWDDIAYNFVIDRYGRIWQGRAWLYPEQPVWPAATLSNNDRTLGISMLGNYDQEYLSSAARKSLDQLIAWEAGVQGINVGGTLPMYNNKTEQYETMPTINAHRDTYFTACPGSHMYPQMASIRREVAALMGNPAPTPSTVTGVFRDFDGMADSDVLGRDSQGRLTLASPTAKGDMTEMELIGGGGWESFDVVTVAGDWSGDGTDDILARNKVTGALWLYPGNGHGGFLAARQIGTGWGGMQAIVAPGDWNGDGKPDIIATNRNDGKMYFYPGDGRGSFAPGGGAIGVGWGQIRSLAAVGKWGGDGRPWLAAVWFNGKGTLYRGSGRGSFDGQWDQPGNWGGYTTLAGITNAYGDKRAGILGVTASGAASFGVKDANGSVAWKPVAQSFAGYTVYGG